MVWCVPGGGSQVTVRTRLPFRFQSCTCLEVVDLRVGQRPTLGTVIVLHRLKIVSGSKLFWYRKGGEQSQ